MNLPRTRSSLLHAVTGGLTVPRLVKLGAVVILVGLGTDLTVHTVLHSLHDQLIGAFPLREHFAHLIVLVGMVLVLAGIVSDGTRGSRTQRRPVRQEGSTRHAVR
jgi:hypothetical protein